MNIVKTQQELEDFKTQHEAQGYSVFRADDPYKLSVGYMAFKVVTDEVTSQEKEVISTCRLFLTGEELPSEVTVLNDAEEFRTKFHELKSKPFFTKCDDPRKLLLGFSCKNDDKVSVFQISLMKAKGLTSVDSELESLFTSPSLPKQ